MVSEKEFLDIYFSDYYANRNIGYEINGIPINDMKNYKSLTLLVNYHCESGCKSHGVTKKGVGKCCCGYCKGNVGYLKNILYTDIPIYAKSFGENGFWTETGCVLPRELRSCLCLTQNCHPDELNIAEHNLLTIIRYGSNAIKSYDDMNYDVRGVITHLKKRLMKNTQLKKVNHGI